MKIFFSSKRLTTINYNCRKIVELKISLIDKIATRDAYINLNYYMELTFIGNVDCY